MCRERERERKMAHPAFKSCLAPVHKGLMWLCHTQMMGLTHALQGLSESSMDDATKHVLQGFAESYVDDVTMHVHIHG